ncbi:hypothetical protein [Roseobacter sp. CCS2]|uniref:hypothetical protein n=1 Tax=Roseobacter sp. CCS2 TaxID=391593 RepID=UPI0000F3FCAD|nr:hypothetical protein [Roseobacter sp. CCS2]EBA10876.1 hypothetical protein RCCS2_00302 [Roseobacter sp. CCS2]
MKFNNIVAMIAATCGVTTAHAGGLSPEIVESSPVDPAPAAAASSVNPAYIVVGILAALLIGAAVSSDNDSGGSDEPEEPLCGRGSEC